MLLVRLDGPHLHVAKMAGARLAGGLAERPHPPHPPPVESRRGRAGDLEIRAEVAIAQRELARQLREAIGPHATSLDSPKVGR